MKICPKCDTVKEDGDFGNRSDKPEELKSLCKACVRVYNKAYRAKHAAKLKLRKAEWAKQDYQKNPEKYRVKKREYKKKFPENFKASTDKYLEANKEKIRARTKLWYEKNREGILEKSRVAHKKYRPVRNQRNRQRRREDPSFRLRGNLRHRVWTALHGGGKTARTFELLGCPVVWLEVHLESLFKPGMTWENYGPVWQVDHIKPCAAFDLTDPEQQRICFHWTNLQPLFKEENMRKGDRPWK